MAPFFIFWEEKSKSFNVDILVQSLLSNQRKFSRENWEDWSLWVIPTSPSSIFLELDIRMHSLWIHGGCRRETCEKFSHSDNVLNVE